MRHSYLKWAFVVLLFSPLFILAQVVIGGSTPPPQGVLLELRGNDKGFLPPRVSSAERIAILNPPEGLIVFDTNLRCLMIFGGGAWKMISAQIPPVPYEPERDTSTHSGNEFGICADIDENIALIGSSTGISIFNREVNGWIEEQFFNLVNVESVAIHKDFALVGIPSQDLVYAFQNTFTDEGWILIGEISGLKLTPTPSVAFGFSVSLTDSIAIVGDPGYNSNSGAVHIFRKTYDPKSPTRRGWTLEQSILGYSIDNQCEFGHSVDIYGSRFAVGAWHYEANVKDPINNHGAVFIYEQSGANWLQKARIGPGDTLRDALFGSSVSLYENRIAIGAQGMDGANGLVNMQGAAYLFELSSAGTWHQALRLLAPDSAATDQFGNSLSLTEDRLVVGAFTKHLDFADVGAAYLYQRKYGRWSFLKKLNDPTGALNGKFGSCVSMFGPYIVVGAPGKRSGKGEVYFME